jgi:riboflavin synthase
MFTGIIEATGIVTAVHSQGNNKTFWIKSPLSASFHEDQSVSHDGVCLTVEETKDDSHRITAIAETLIKSNLENWQTGTTVNLERSLQLNARIDGHLVQGHVDTVARCTGIIEKKGSWEFTFEMPTQFSNLVIEKGSIAINGISLTLFNVGRAEFSVAIIPYTYEYTNIREVKQDTIVNLEFDMLGKYVNRIYSLNKSASVH